MTKSDLIPDKNELYVPFGAHDQLKKIIESKLFLPTYISGLSGNGKTFMVEQVCAELNREIIRVNITEETDEDDLLGGFRLVNGETVWHDGPVITALERGAVLLLDEVDLNQTKILCLQPILEGNGIFLKKVGKVVKPTLGFTVVATANTKGGGCESGKFIGTQVQNEAFLERFVLTFEQKYPPVEYEKNILTKLLESLEVDADELYVDKLVEWANKTRDVYEQSGSQDLITTRRLVHIIKTFSVFKDRHLSVLLCLNRFDEITKKNFYDFFYTLLPDKDLDINGGSPDLKPNVSLSVDDYLSKLDKY